tara:strand:+ start:2915 stop:4108 length:1194 start_codon:yes stop_codon:yes gene_type:complete
MQYIDSDSTIFNYSKHFKKKPKFRSYVLDNEKDVANKNDIPVALPMIPYKNLRCVYNDTVIWISNIYVVNQIVEGNNNHPPTLLVLSIESDCENYTEFFETGFMQDLYKKSKIWHMTNVLGEPYDESNYFEVYTFNDGYWDLKKGNRIREENTLFLNGKMSTRLLSKISKFNQPETKKLYRRLNIPYKLNILLHGPPGTGKTSFIELTASRLRRNIKFMQITPSITDEKFSTAVSQLGDNDILVCEDIDCLFTDRKDSDSKKNAMTFSGLLNSLDGINGGKNGLIVFMTTNYKCRLDSALTRPGRVDITEEFRYMDYDCLKKMVSFYFEDKFCNDKFQKLYNKIKSYNLTGAIMSNFLLGLILDKNFEIDKQTDILKKLLEENNYEKDSYISKSLYN